jgi:hypothetical protein
MKRWSLWMVCVAAALSGCADEPLEGAPADLDKDAKEIVGGVATVIEDLPWQVSLREFGSHFCGGTIIHPEWIVTAAHCVEGGVNGVTVVAGETYRARSTGQTRTLAGGVIYPGYADPSLGKDIALLRLSSPLDLSGPRARAIPLVSPALANAGITNPGVIATVSGWGALRTNGSSPSQLQKVDIPIVSMADARRAYGTLTEDQLSAGVLGVGGKDSCQGDSGGPLVVPGPDGEPALAGVVSWGNGCGSARYPGMYARVSSFYDWIIAQTGPLSPQNPGDNTPDPTPDPDPAGDTFTGALNKGQSASFGPFDVTGATSFAAALNGSGDPDLYVRFGAAPTLQTFTCRSWESGAVESCLLDVPSGQTQAYVLVYGYAASNFTLSVGIEGGAPTPDPEPEPEPSAEINTRLTGQVQRNQRFNATPIAVAPGSTFRVVMSGTGDADLYARVGAAPTLQAFDCRPYGPDSNETCTLTAPAQGGQVYLMVNGYSASNFTLDLTYTPAP